MGWLYYRGSARGFSECDQLLVPTAHGRGPWLSMRLRRRRIKRPCHPGPALPSLQAAVDLAASRRPFPSPGSPLITSPPRAPQRTHRLPKEMTPVEPAAFAAELIARLEKLKLELETRHSLEERLQQIQEVGAAPSPPPRISGGRGSC